MDLTQNTQQPKIVSFICGKLCAGKTKYAEALAQSCAGAYIEVSSIVKKIHSLHDRAELQNTKHLHSIIVTELKKFLQTVPNDDVIISGVRQVEILSAFPGATMLWIETPREIRKERFEKRNRPGDTDFETAEQGDINLGINKVKEYILKQ
jgi:cytidylate kinase